MGSGEEGRWVEMDARGVGGGVEIRGWYMINYFFVFGYFLYLIMFIIVLMIEISKSVCEIG